MYWLISEHDLLAYFVLSPKKEIKRVFKVQIFTGYLNNIPSFITLNFFFQNKFSKFVYFICPPPPPLLQINFLKDLEKRMKIFLFLPDFQAILIMIFICFGTFVTFTWLNILFLGNCNFKKWVMWGVLVAFCLPNILLDDMFHFKIKSLSQKASIHIWQLSVIGATLKILKSVWKRITWF